MKCLRSSPAGMGSRNSTTIRPGYLMKPRRGQNMPELSATGTTGRRSAPATKPPDRDRTAGAYFVRYVAPGTKADEPGFFGKLFGSAPTKEEIETRAERYQVRLSKVGESVQVTVEKNINTVAPAETARKVLGVIQDNLG